jgi:hypothetical protein
VPALLASAEGAALLLLTLLSWRRLRSIPALSRGSPYVLFVVIYALIFVYLFSSIGNFGVLGRQRAQLYPLLLVLFVLPQHRRGAPPAGEEETATPEPYWTPVSAAAADVGVMPRWHEPAGSRMVGPGPQLT